MRKPIIAMLLLASVAGCADEQEPAPEPVTINVNRARILATLPALPRTVLADTTGSNEAERATYIAEAPLDTVLRFFRDSLRQRGWRLVNDVSDSTVGNLYLEKDSMTVWLSARPVGSGTLYTLLASAGIPLRGDTVASVP